MIHHRIKKHFVPHFIVEPSLVGSYPEPHKLHHRAHALSLVSLFAYLQIVIVLSAGLFLIRLKAPQVLGVATYSANQIITLTNQKRAENGLGALTFNAALAQAASAKSAYMFKEDFWAHNSPTGVTPWSFITAAGYKYIYAGENLARDFNDAASVVDAWMNSPSHRANILDRNFKEIGVSVASGTLTGKEGILVVQMFGTGVSQIPQTQQLANEEEKKAESVAGETKTATKEPPEVVQVPEEVLNQPAPKESLEATVLASRRFSIAKGVSLALIGFIFVLLFLEAVISIKREHARLRAGVLAHLGLLAFILFAVWYAVQGAIL